MVKRYHRAFGVYGIIGNAQHLVVIKKNGGPYINRYDLPGGSLDEGEPLENAIVREIHEETGLIVRQPKQIGITSFRYPWNYQRWTENQHICVFYRVRETNNQLASAAPQFIGQDSLGAVALPLAELSIANASPLVLRAKKYLLNDEIFDVRDQYLADWTVLDRPVFK